MNGFGKKEIVLAPSYRRYACKRFAADCPLDPSELETILEAGRLAPSSFGLEPCLFCLAVSPPVISRIADACLGQEAVSTANAAIVIVARRAKHYDPSSAFIRSRASRFPGGLAVFLEDYKNYWRLLKERGRLDEWSRAQGYLAAQAMMIAAAALDLDSCPIEGYDEKALLTVMDIDPSDWLVSLVLALGHGQQPVRARIREKLDVLVRSLD